MGKRDERLEVIKKILAENRVRDQQHLADLLFAQTGLNVSQSSLSRDLKALGAARTISTDGSLYYTLPESPPISTTAESFRRRFATSVTGIRRSEFLVLIYTGPGEASLIARLLDRSAHEGLLATVAGDDTIICVTLDTATARKLEAELKGLTSR